MEKKKVLVLLGHSDTETLTGEIANAYEEGARAAGHEVRRINIGELHFDPILHKGYKVIQELEPDLIRVQEDIKWCDHLVILYPNWWSSMPALLKGLFDRMWLPGFSFRYYKEGIGRRLHLWKRMMAKKTARVIVTSGARPFFIWLFVGDYTNEIARGVLWFVGFDVEVTLLGPSENISPRKKSRWLLKMHRLGERAK
ncbi:hypothetical protein A3D66_02665 [Candidatus Kaiserbacteria bacterium RIFCSPHIGHO2_02_FULL_50_9]|uniref:Flavodoxin-like fold domain-containing protein n=1 Tax=Candidatus Kaiserbacteria bacterium RIFCSPLOWO2_01_FULL_51_21 TaxID=1798508 RepID=A0A1F6EDK0_9BACT|nr:MAG: hypothetical protein A2761_00525 [Candidatus Kaiserbacteria bacterium RIFCSPHIGHO2_01_FULL_51_33]OGG63557.1 MAG: hypothetical protein A3D66_02665 [Candidatus Kaiserbacteria bacterium RIFCSPHIGHO2_02_FULL_50_9]OGG71743.1 MAG: hypothetical protein A3A35_01950 [Candidatus Kaiserbacteria bacterium RIFCSPLOWO2_01_FULL_51_21]